MADFPEGFGPNKTTLGTVINRLEDAPQTRRSALDGWISAARPYKDESLSATLASFPATAAVDTSPWGNAWELLRARINQNQAQDDSEIARRIAALSDASERYSAQFFGPTSLSKAERDALLRQLVDIFKDPRGAVTSVGDRNAARTATRALLDAEVARAKGFLGSEYVVPATAITLRTHRALNIIDRLNDTSLTALERRFLAFDDSLQGQYMQARVQAMRALYGEPAAAYATSLAFASQVVVPAYARGEVNQARADDILARFAKIHETGFGVSVDSNLLAEQRSVALLRNKTDVWKNRHQLKDLTFSEASQSVAAAASEVSKQLSAALNAVGGSGSIGDSFSSSDHWPTVNIEDGVLI